LFVFLRMEGVRRVAGRPSRVTVKVARWLAERLRKGSSSRGRAVPQTKFVFLSETREYTHCCHRPCRGDGVVSKTTVDGGRYAYCALCEVSTSRGPVVVVVAGEEKDVSGDIDG